MLLSPTEAAPIAGVPPVQLERWAWLDVGPRNVGTRGKPRYRSEDLEAWRKAKGRGTDRRYMPPDPVDGAATR